MVENLAKPRLSKTWRIVIIVSAVVIVCAALGVGLYFGLRPKGVVIIPTPTPPIPITVPPTPVPIPPGVVEVTPRYLYLPFYVSTRNNDVPGRFIVVDTKTNTQVGDPVVLTDPSGGEIVVALAPSLTQLYVISNNAGVYLNLATFDVSTPTSPRLESVVSLLGSNAQQKSPVAAVVSPDSNYLYIAFQGQTLGGGILQVKVDTNRLTWFAQGPTIQQPIGLLMNPAGTRLYVINGNGGYSRASIATIDISAEASPLLLEPALILEPSPPATLPFGLRAAAISKNGKSLYAIAQVSATAASHLYTVDLTTPYPHLVTKSTTPVLPVGVVPHALNMNSDQTSLLCSVNDGVYVMNLLGLDVIQDKLETVPGFRAYATSTSSHIVALSANTVRFFGNTSAATITLPSTWNQLGSSATVLYSY